MPLRLFQVILVREESRVFFSQPEKVEDLSGTRKEHHANNEDRQKVKPLQVLDHEESKLYPEQDLHEAKEEVRFDAPIQVTDEVEGVGDHVLEDFVQNADLLPLVFVL